MPREGYTIVTKDADFRQRSFLLGPPPKVIWIGLGNCSTQRNRRLSASEPRNRSIALAEDQAFLVLR